MFTWLPTTSGIGTPITCCPNVCHNDFNTFIGLFDLSTWDIQHSPSCQPVAAMPAMITTLTSSLDLLIFLLGVSNIHPAANRFDNPISCRSNFDTFIRLFDLRLGIPNIHYSPFQQSCAIRWAKLPHLLLPDAWCIDRKRALTSSSCQQDPVLSSQSICWHCQCLFQQYYLEWQS